MIEPIFNLWPPIIRQKAPKVEHLRGGRDAVCQHPIQMRMRIDKARRDDLTMCVMNGRVRIGDSQIGVRANSDHMRAFDGNTPPLRRELCAVVDQPISQN